ncbi:MAG: hypothetical protein QGG00_02415 [Verrucomicrobiota bacterium]|jgi:hypothetical protein|nr:hypothetical protein [Verrucomicrobiota bacterium]
MLDFQKIRRKQKWLFGVIAIPVIFGFVILFTPDAEDRLFGRGGQAESGSYGQLDGEIVTRNQWLEAQGIILAPIRMRFGGQLPNLNSDLIDSQIPNILREQALMRRFGINPSQDDSIDWISRFIDSQLEGVPAVSRPTHQEEYSRMTAALGGDGPLLALARHQVGADQLRRLSGVSGVLLSAKETEIRYRENNEQYEAEGIFLSHTNYLPLVQANEEQLKQHYTNTLASHIIPPRRQMSYVTFPATNYLDEAEKKFDALNAMERDGFLTNYWAGITDLPGYKTNSLSDLTKQIVPVRTNEYAGMKIEEATADIRKKILTLPWGLKAGLAVVEAYNAGRDFRISLEATHKAQPALDTLEKMALLQNLTASTTQAMTNRVNGTVSELPSVALEDLFQLSVTNAFIVGDSFNSGASDFFIASLKRIIPSRRRSFAEAKSIVTAGYKKGESIKLMKQAGEKVHQSIKTGKSLAEVAKDNNLTVAKLGPFNSAGGGIPGLANKANSEDFRTQALGLEIGAASELITSSTDPSDPIAEEAAFVVKLTSKTQVSKEKFNEEFADYLENERASAVAQAYTPWLQRRAEDTYKYSLNIGVEEGEGSFELDGKKLTRGFYKRDTRVKIVAKPDNGYEFKEWASGVIVNTGVAENEIVVQRNTYISASFAPKAP